MADLNPGSGSSSPFDLTVFNNALYFGAFEPTSGTELWRYDGTTVAQVADLNPGSGSSFLSEFTVFNGALYFRATDGTSGSELWRHDGTTASRVADLNPGAGSSTPSGFTVFDNVLYFRATDGTSGVELWRHDGSTTSRVADVNPGSGSSNPSELTVFNNALYFRALEPTSGAELWRHQPGALTLALSPGQVVRALDFGNYRVVDIGTSRRAKEGDGISFTANVSDPNPATSSTFTYQWQASDADEQIIATGAAQAFTFTPSDEGRYAVTVTVTDLNDSNRTYQDTVDLLVSNMAPALEAGADTRLSEGGTLIRDLTFTDPGADTWTATVDFGDGSSTIASPTGKTFTLDHIYADDGVYEVLVSVADGDGGVATDSLRVTVANVSPKLVSVVGEQEVAEGAAISLLGTFSDPGFDKPAPPLPSRESFTARIKWGDGAVDLFPARVDTEGANGRLTVGSFDGLHTYADNGTFTVEVSVADDDGGVAERTLRVLVKNVAPTLALSGAPVVAEGTPYTLTLGPPMDKGQDTVTELIVRWGDGITQSFPTPGAVTHIYANGGATRTIAVDLVDEDGTHAGASHQVIVQNVTPVLSEVRVDSAAIDENGLVTLSGSFQDPGVRDPHTVGIVWGDGTISRENLATGERTFSVKHKYLDDTPSRTPADRHTITVTLSDEARAAIGTATVTVRNVVPTITALDLSATEIDEGSPITVSGAVVDPSPQDTLRVVIDWDDGSPLEPALLAPDRNFSLSHRYRKSGAYVLGVTAIDDDGGARTATRRLTVSDVAPALTGLSLKPEVVDEGAIFTRAGSFTDPSAVDAWTGTVDFGDGSVLPLPLRPDKTFELRHVFADDRAIPFTVAVTVRDFFGEAETRRFGVTVENVAPAVDAGADTMLTAGQTLGRAITFTDPGADIWTATIDFGDGTAPVELPNLTTRSFEINHPYLQPGERTVAITVADDETQATDTFTVTVLDIINDAPMLAPVDNRTIREGEEFTLTLTASDADFPAQMLTFTLWEGAPDGATINGTTFTWAPTLALTPNVYPVTVRVTDNGSPALFAEQTFTVTVLPSLDADGNGTADATDGQIILRYLSGHPDGQLLTGVPLGSGATRTTPGAIRSYLDAGKTFTPAMLDPDGNGQFTAFTDGRLIFRYLSGITGPALVGGSVIGAGTTRTTAPAIEAYLNGFRPLVPASAASEAAGLLSTAAVAPTEALSVAPQEAPIVLAQEHIAAPPEAASAPLAARNAAAKEARPSATPASTGADLLIDWSRFWAGWRNGQHPEKGLKSGWLKPFLFDLAEDDPNGGIQVALADYAPTYDSVRESIGHGPQGPGQKEEFTLA